TIEVKHAEYALMLAVIMLGQGLWTAACRGSMLFDSSAATCVGTGMVTTTVVPEGPDSMFSVPLYWRKRSRMPLIPTPEPFDWISASFSEDIPLPWSCT